MSEMDTNWVRLTPNETNLTCLNIRFHYILTQFVILASNLTQFGADIPVTEEIDPESSATIDATVERLEKYNNLSTI